MPLENQELWSSIQQLNKQLDDVIDRYGAAGEALAIAEHNYQVALRKAALEEKNAGVAVTFINGFLRGKDEIAELREVRDIAEAKHDTLGEKINSIKLQIRILDSQYSREWSDRPDNY